jgi:acetylornithine deacetylase
MKAPESYLMDLIRIPSVSSISNRSVIEYAQGVLHSAQWNTVPAIYVDTFGIEKVNLIAAPPGQDPNEQIVDLAFLCHTDTVPPASDWTAALEPFVDAGVIYGCGACDVKGFLACLLTAASQVPASSFSRELRIVLTADEEIGCIGSHRLIEGTKLRPRSLVVGEPTSLQPARAGKGYCLAEVTVFGAEAHSAHPHKGRSAIYDAARLIQAIHHLSEQLAANGDPFFDPPYTTINIGTIQGGTAKNVIPGECRFLVEWRPVPNGERDCVPEAIERITQELTQADPEFRSNFVILRQQSGFETGADSNLVRTMERLTGRDAISIPFGSEASVFASRANEIVVFGPGDMRTAHSPRECVPISELNEAVRCVKALMLEP